MCDVRRESTWKSSRERFRRPASSTGAGFSPASAPRCCTWHWPSTRGRAPHQRSHSATIHLRSALRRGSDSRWCGAVDAAGTKAAPRRRRHAGPTRHRPVAHRHRRTDEESRRSRLCLGLTGAGSLCPCRSARAEAGPMGISIGSQSGTSTARSAGHGRLPRATR